jgi:hypothetical protein
LGQRAAFKTELLHLAGGGADQTAAGEGQCKQNPKQAEEKNNKNKG